MASKKIEKPELKPNKIPLDDAEENPTPDFKELVSAISEMLVGSTSEYAVGIYGNWGTCKTTLQPALKDVGFDVSVEQSIVILHHLIKRTHSSETWQNQTIPDTKNR